MNICIKAFSQNWIYINYLSFATLVAGYSLLFFATHEEEKEEYNEENKKTTEEKEEDNEEKKENDYMEEEIKGKTRDEEDM